MNKAENISLPDAIVRVDKLPANGRKIKVVAEKDQLPAIAQHAKVSAVKYLKADLLVSAFKGGVRVSGRLLAEVSQPCVVTLAPLSQLVDEPVERAFLLGPDINADAAAGSQTFIDLSLDEIPDYFEGSRLDLSALLLEVLGLSIELYPRAPDAKMRAEQAGDELAKLSPFAVLRSGKPADSE